MKKANTEKIEKMAVDLKEAMTFMRDAADLECPLDVIRDSVSQASNRYRDLVTEVGGQLLEVY